MPDRESNASTSFQYFRTVPSEDWVATSSAVMAGKPDSSELTIKLCSNAMPPSEQALIDIIDDAELADISIVILVDKEGMVSTSWSDGELIRILGALDFAKKRIQEIQTA